MRLRLIVRWAAILLGFLVVLATTDARSFYAVQSNYGRAGYGVAAGPSRLYGGTKQTLGGIGSGYGKTSSPRTNILVILGDDFSKDWLATYGAAHANTPTTPSIDAIATNGIRFDVHYATPLCAPTHASLMTGRWQSRHGIVVGGGGPLLSSSEQSFFAAIERGCPGCYDFGHFGKYNARDLIGDPEPFKHAGRMGIQTWVGSSGPALLNYRSWTQYTMSGRGPNNEQITQTNATQTVYATDEHSQEAVAFIQARPRRPWVLFFYDNNAHSPFHDPAELVAGTPGASCELPLTTEDCFELQIESDDLAVGNLVAAVDTNNTLVVWIGDNGSSVTAPGDSIVCKGKAVECGMNVAAIIGYGPTVANATNVADLTSVVDIFATIIDVAGGELDTGLLENVADGASDPQGRYNGQARATDGFSLMGIIDPGSCEGYATCWTRGDNLHTYILAETSTNVRVARGVRYKYHQTATDLFFDLDVDPNELTDLLGGMACAAAGLTAPEEAECIALDAFITAEYTGAL